MNTFKFIKIAAVFFVPAAIGCTKLNQNLNSTLTSAQAGTALGSNGTQLLLQNAYNDLAAPYHNVGTTFALEEVTADQCVVPTRAGDWDDGGEWRALKKQSFTANGTSHISGQFNSLNKLNFDATNVLAFSPTKQQSAEARFIRAISLYQLLDLFGQYPFRNPGDNLLNAPKVLSGEEAVQFIISELNAIIPDLPSSTTMDKASKDAANFLLMRAYLNHGAFVTRAVPTYTDADMQKVISLGNAIISSGKYSYSANYFDNFIPLNSGSKEAIFGIPSTKDNYQDFHNRWYATLHYNQYTPKNPQAGWNGFSTVSDFYNSFGINSTPTQTLADSVLDGRIGERVYKNCTEISGVRPGMLIGQQYNENGVALKDRQNNPLIFNPNIVDNLKETGSDLEVKGIRVIKYVPDYSNNGANYGGPAAGNLILFRYPDVVLMVAEAKMRAASPDNTGALAMVNALRVARQAAPLTTMTLVNTTFIADPKTLLAERGRELYWESVRRTDLIRFGVYMKAWQLKPASDATHLVFPIPGSALAANPNLKQNPGY